MYLWNKKTFVLGLTVGEIVYSLIVLAFLYYASVTDWDFIFGKR